MRLTESLDKIKECKLEDYPFPYFVLNNFFSQDNLSLILEDLRELESQEPTSVFESNFGQKKEWKKFPESLEHLTGLLNFLAGKDFIDVLKLKFGIDKEVDILPDPTYDGGGYVVSPPESFLAYHADFNFSSKANMYRVLNILIYMNENYSEKFGGQLHLLDKDSKTVEKVVNPGIGTLLGFFTDDTSFHGVSKNKGNFFRKSFNIYYYCKVPISPNQSKDPHKTIWVETKSHHH